jgi:hypothetical protein
MRRIKHPSTRQSGVASILALVAILTSVMLILTQSIRIASDRFVDEIQHQDATTALYAAETGIEHIAGRLIDNAENDPETFSTVCDALDDNGSQQFSVGRASFQILQSIIESRSTALVKYCQFRTAGSVRSSRRTLEQTLKMSIQEGVGGFGTSVEQTLRNTRTVDAFGVFNLAWRRSGSVGYDELASSGQSVATNCTLPSCAFQWRLESSSGDPSIGSLGAIARIAGRTAGQVSNSYNVTQELSLARNFGQVGLILPKVDDPNVPIRARRSYWGYGTGTTWGIRQTRNNNATDSSEGGLISGAVRDGLAPLSSGAPPLACTTTASSTYQSCTDWCHRADTLVFGVSARTEPPTSTTGEYSPGVYSTSFTSVFFDSDDTGYSGQKVALKRVAHFPSVTSPMDENKGDLFSEIYYLYNPYLYARVDTITSAPDPAFPSSYFWNVTLQNTETNPIVGSVVTTFEAIDPNSGQTITENMRLRAYAGSESQPVTRVIQKSSQTSFKVQTETNVQPFTAGGLICGGICAFFRDPSTGTSTTKFRVNRSNASVRQWAGGFSCFSGIDPKEIRFVGGTSFRFEKWREIYTNASGN